MAQPQRGFYSSYCCYFELKHMVQFSKIEKSIIIKLSIFTQCTNMYMTGYCKIPCRSLNSGSQHFLCRLVIYGTHLPIKSNQLQIINLLQVKGYLRVNQCCRDFSESFYNFTSIHTLISFFPQVFCFLGLFFF